MKNLLIFVIASVLLQQAIANKIIPKDGNCPLSHQVYTTCGSACALTCDNYKNPPQFCTMQCIIGCVCEEGYVKKSDGSCCLPDECAPKDTQPSCTLAHEVYKECGTACPPTCDNYNETISCTKQCVKGCYCEDDYVRNSDGSCCLPDECEPTVSQSCTLDHEVYTDCGSACPKTCDNINVEMMCIDMCVEGCFCEDGYVRNSDGSCCLPDECEPTISEQSCPRYEVYNTCGTACPLTCENYANPPRFCTKNCVIGCFCEAGYVKKSDGSCCLPEDCRPKKPAGIRVTYNLCAILTTFLAITPKTLDRFRPNVIAMLQAFSAPC